MKPITHKSKPKKLSLSKEKKKAWKAFSEYIRRSSADRNGNCVCYTCGKTYPWKEINAGHGIGGRNGAILFLEEIVRPQCYGCNVWGRGQYHRFTINLIRELGMERFQEIVDGSEKITQYKAQDYIAIRAKYEELLGKLKEVL